MSIDAYIICWNEIETIHLTISHYQKFCRHIYIFDNFSDDGTREVCEKMGCIVSCFGTRGVLDDKEYLKIKNNKWKDSTAQWVIVCDADEIFIPPNLWNTDVTIYKTYGWNVFSNNLPRAEWSEITTGIHDPNYSKLVCFNPKEVKEINYVYGCHKANPVGNVNYSNGAFPLFHYKHIGGANRVADRHALYAQRMSAFNRKWKLGYQYDEAREKTIKYFNECLAKSRPFSQVGF